MLRSLLFAQLLYVRLVFSCIEEKFHWRAYRQLLIIYQLCFWPQLENDRAQGEIQWNEKKSRKVGEKNLHVT